MCNFLIACWKKNIANIIYWTLKELTYLSFLLSSLWLNWRSSLRIWMERAKLMSEHLNEILIHPLWDSMQNWKLTLKSTIATETLPKVLQNLIVWTRVQTLAMVTSSETFAIEIGCREFKGTGNKKWRWR